MSVGDWLPYAVLLIAGLGASAFFGGVETGAYTVNRLRLAIRAERGEPRARLLLDELRQPNRWLATLLVGNTLAGYVSSSAIAHILEAWGLSPVAGMIVDAIVLLPLLVVFGETLPKEVFRVHADSWTVAVAPMARWLRWMLTLCGAVPLLVWLGDVAVRRFRLAPSEVVDARMRVVELLRESRGAVDERQVAMAGRVLELSRRGVGTMMTPWKRVASLADDALPQVVRETLRTRPRASYPVIDADGACVGVVTAIDMLVEPDASPAAIARKPVLVPPSMLGLHALRLMREAGVSIAVVIDHRSPIGVVSVRDVLEPVLGRLPGW